VDARSRPLLHHAQSPALAIQAARVGLLDHRPAPPSSPDSRAAIGLIELYTLDAQGGSDIVKLNPMANWPREAIWRHIRQHKIPYNPLHDLGYASIGCMTCTRKTARGEDERAGRWIGFKKVECGIHTFMSRKNDFQIYLKQFSAPAVLCNQTENG
jgi:3'-phosphoadenosine 5'-phosphosulfate sulfotransferase (PAPS reductase)/FAD synthetase